MQLIILGLIIGIPVGWVWGWWERGSRIKAKREQKRKKQGLDPENSWWFMRKKHQERKEAHDQERTPNPPN